MSEFFFFFEIIEDRLTERPLAEEEEAVAVGCLSPGKLIPSFLSCSTNLARELILESFLNSFTQFTRRSFILWVTRGSERD